MMESNNDVMCAMCGDAMDIDDAYTAQDHGDWHCRECVTECVECGYMFADIDSHMDRYCDYCDNYRCDDAWFYRCEDCDNSYCESCADRGGCNCGGSNGVRPYDWNPPEFIMHGSGNMFGIELEVGGNDGDIVSTVRHYDDSETELYMKHDGSICGVEIISHPMSLDYAAGYPFDLLLRDLQRAGCYVNDGYGLHVHVGRDAFRADGGRGKYSQLHAFRWIKFVYENERNVERTVARRSSEQWAKFRKFDSGELRRKSRNMATRDDRYVAINTTNRATMELRVCKSTLDASEFYSAIEFMEASIEYTRHMDSHTALRGGMSWDTFRRYLVDAGGRYSHLLAVLVDDQDDQDGR